MASKSTITLLNLEAARQALEEAGETGLTGGELLDAADLPRRTRRGGTNVQGFLMQLTTYCACYESDGGNRYYLNTAIDDGFHRRIIGQDGLFDAESIFGPEEAADEEEDYE